MPLDIGSRLAVGGGYDMDPEWLPNGQEVTGTVVAWIARPEGTPSCLLRLDRPMSAEGLVQGKRELCTGDHLLLSTRYVGQDWEGDERTVHVSLVAASPGLDTYDAWVAAGAWVESHATYRPLSG